MNTGSASVISGEAGVNSDSCRVFPRSVANRGHSVERRMTVYVRSFAASKYSTKVYHVSRIMAQR